MGIAEKVEQATNNNILVLNKEGLFYKLYNKHAMYFTQHIKLLKIQCKWFKNIEQHVFIVGFPASSFENLKDKLQDLNITVEKDSLSENIKLFIPEKIVDQVYLNWVSKQNTIKVNKITANAIIDKLKTFQISNNTPMQAMQFLHNLQNQTKDL